MRDVTVHLCPKSRQTATSFLFSGFIIDQTGNYDLPFYIYGALMAPPALVFTFLTCIFPSTRSTRHTPAASEEQPSATDVAPRTRKETVNDIIMRSTTSLATQH